MDYPRYVRNKKGVIRRLGPRRFRRGRGKGEVRRWKVLAEDRRNR